MIQSITDDIIICVHACIEKDKLGDESIIIMSSDIIMHAVAILYREMR